MLGESRELQYRLQQDSQVSLQSPRLSLQRHQGVLPEMARSRLLGVSKMACPLQDLNMIEILSDLTTVSAFWSKGKMDPLFMSDLPQPDVM